MTSKSTNDRRFVVSGAELARLFEVQRSTVTRDWIKAGCPQTKGGQFDLREVIPWRIKYEQKRIEQQIGEEKAARIALIRAKTRYEQIRIGIARRKFISAEQLERLLAEQARETRTVIDAIPRAWAPRINAENPAEAEAILEEMISSVRRRLSQIEEAT